jgi:hypothetical protein
MIAVGVKATTLTPFAYHSLMVQSGTATIPQLISDAAIAFALAASLGMAKASVALPPKDYRRDWRAVPWRTSIFETDNPRLLPPLTRRRNLDAEAGLQKKVQDVARKGNLKDFFSTQEVPPGQVFTGAVFGTDPFELSGESEIVARVGLHRGGMVRLEKTTVANVCLNAATAALFDQELPVSRYLLHTLQLTPPMDLNLAGDAVLQWK